MKTSNIIVVSLIASITLIITSGMMEFRLKGVPAGSVLHKSPGIRQTPIPQFHAVVVQHYPNVSLDVSDAFNLGTIGLPESIPGLSYEVKNDTLYIKGSPDDPRPEFVNISAPAQQIKELRALDAHVIVNNPSLDRFVVHSDHANVSINTLETISTLVVEGVNNARIDFFQSSAIHTLDLNLDHSEIYTSGSLGSVKGSIKNQSRANLSNANALTFTRDSTSYLQVWTN
jgi:hypothetical protein